MNNRRLKAKTMRRKRQAGFSLLEVMTSLSIFLILFLAAVTAIIGSMYLGSFVKHKVQAMYWAQRFIEEERRVPFANLTSLASTPFILDRKAVFDADPDTLTSTTGSTNLRANRIVTVTAIDANRKRIRIEINWTEKIMRGMITLRDYYSTDIANDVQLN